MSCAHDVPKSRPDRDAGNVAPLALRAKEAARVLGISERHIRSLTMSGRLPHVRVGRAVLYPVKALLAWLEREAAKSVRRSRTQPPGA